jgi:phosphoglucomutase
MGGASLEYYASIKDRYGLNLTIVNPSIDMTFSFMPPDHDGKIRMDCSSPKAMANMIKLKDKYDISWGNDTDSDRHGIVTRSNGLLNPNHFLAVAIYYLLRHRPSWKSGLAVGKTVVSSSMIDKVVKYLKRDLLETPVGFKYFSDGFLKEKICFGGEESAGASFLKKDGSVWTTDKDGIIMGLLAAEILAVTGKDPGTIYEEQTKMFGTPVYERIDTPASPKMKERLKALSADQIKSKTLAGEKIISIMTKAPNGEPIGGLKVTAENGWFAARPSGTEDIAKLYAESFIGFDHLRNIQSEAKIIIEKAAV